ncbi:MAG: fused MFS/spermidine synthase [Nitrospinae bacterium]|nr:fused MFS/spermidine synthase [Nitrospinota bacterium]
MPSQPNRNKKQETDKNISRTIDPAGVASPPSALIQALVFVSGAAGLIYQGVWVRELSLVFGNTVYAVSIVVAAFLTGLALGSHFFGKAADATRLPLKLYIGLEVGIAISALLVTFLIRVADNAIVGAMDVESINSGSWILIRYVSLFVLLAGPTMLMGGTLPVMSRFFVGDLKQVGKGVGSLYAFNTYGGTVGALASGFLLGPWLGVIGSLAVAVILNLVVAGTLWFRFKDAGFALPHETQQQAVRPREEKKKKTDADKEAAFTRAPVSVALALTLFFLAGFCSLAFEILWTRAFIVSYKSTVYLFTNLLAVFLLGMGLGSHIFSRSLDKSRDPLALFGLAQVGIGVLGCISVIFFAYSYDITGSLAGMVDEIDWRKDIVVMLILMTMVFLLPTILMGLAYPLVCMVTTASLSTLGRSAGLSYSIGTAGGILGSLAVAFLMLPAIGLQRSVFAISALAMATGFIALAKSVSRKTFWWVPFASAIPALALFIMFEISGVNIGLGAKTPDNIVFAQEGVMGTVRVTQKDTNGPLKLLVNNYQLATSGDVAVRFGHIPLILKPEAKDVLLISLGSGITAGAVGLHDKVERIECVEIVPTLLEAQRLFAKENRKIVSDRRFHLTFWDGRHYARVTKRKYDVVISDLFQPDSAGVGYLYSLEHFRNVKATLNKGGIMAQWLPLYQLSPDNLKVIMRTFAEAFEHVEVFSGDINSEYPALALIGSSEPLVINPANLMKSLSEEVIKEDIMERSDPLSFLSFYVMDRAGVMEFAKDAPLNTDDRPVIEYQAPRYMWKRSANAISNFTLMSQNRKNPIRLIPGAEKDAEFSTALERYTQGRSKLLEGKIHHAKRDYPAEFESYKEAAKLVPHDPFLSLAVFDLGYMYYYRRDFQSSTKLFDWARKINPDLLEAYFYLGKSYQQMGNADKFKEVMGELIRMRPELADSLVKKP